MSHPALDALWDTPTQKKSQLDSLWDTPTKPKITQEVSGDGFWNTLGNYGKYMASLTVDPSAYKFAMGNALMPAASIISNRDQYLNIAKSLGTNLESFGKDVWDILGENPQTAMKYIQPVMDKFSGNRPTEVAGNLVKGGALGIISMPITFANAITNTKVGPNGEVQPVTPEEEAQNIQSTVGLIISSGVAEDVYKAVAPNPANISKNYIGRVAQAAYPKAISGLAAGGAYGGISGIGSEHQLADAMGDALSFATIGALWRPFKGARELQIEAGKANQADIQNRKATAQEIAAIRSLQISPEDSPKDIANKLDAFSLGGNGLDAFLRANLPLGKSLVIDDPTVNVDDLIKKYTVSDRTSEGPYVPPESLDNIKLKRGNNWVNALDPFDKAVLASKGNSDLIKDIKDQTGLSNAEITAHRNYLNDQLDKAQPRNRTPLEQKMDAEDAVIKGQSLIGNIQEGQTKKINGQTWTKVGNNLTNGQSSFNINDPQLATQLSGLDYKPTDKVIDLFKQNFNPNYGREVAPKIEVYKGPQGQALVSNGRIPQPSVDFFQKTGYLPSELVSVNGNPANVKGLWKDRISITDIATGKNFKVKPEAVQRLPGGLDSEALHADNGNEIPRLMVLNRESYFDNLYESFKKTTPLDEVPKESYAKSIARFAANSGLKNADDIADMARAFHSRMMNEALDSDTKEVYQGGLKNLEDYQKGVEDNLANQLHKRLINNNLRLFNIGGGTYDIRDENGIKLTSVKTLDEANKWLTDSRQANGYDLDGGESNGQPMQGGALQDDWNIKSNWLSQWMDKKFNIGWADSYIISPNPRNAIAAMDTHMGTNFYPHYQALQTGLTHLRNLALGKYKPTIDARGEVLDAGSKLSFEEKENVAKKFYNMNYRDIMDHFPLTQADESFASQISFAGTSDVIQFLYKVRQASGFKDVNLGKAIKSVSDKFDPDVVAMGKNLLQISNGSNKPSAILRLAYLLDNGESTTTPLNEKEQLFHDKLKKFHDIAYGADDQLYTHPMMSYLAELTGYNPFNNTNVLRKYNAMNVTPGGQMSLDPLTAVYNYTLAGSRSSNIIPEKMAYPMTGGDGLISFDDIIQRARQELNSLNVKRADEPGIAADKEKKRAAREYFQKYLENAMGIPDMSKLLTKAAQEAISNLYGGSTVKNSNDWIRFGNALTYASLLGGRPAFAIRDGLNAITNIANYDSYTAAAKIAGMSISKEYAQKLIADGVIPQQDFIQLLQAGEDLTGYAGRVAKAAEKLEYLSDISTKLNGQQLLHMQMTAGTYRYYYEKVGQLSKDMVSGGKSKEDAYSELKISKLPPAEQKYFDDLITAGKTEGAAQFLGKNMADRINVTYGNYNAPLNWNTKFGKLAGAFSQWAVHQINTNLDTMTRGTRGDILASNAKMLANNAAIMLAGYSTGINLSKWMINPASLPSQSPLLNGILGVAHDAENMLAEDPAISNPAWSAMTKMLPSPGNWGHLYLPGSFMVQDIQDFNDMMQGDFGPSSYARLMGFSPIKTTTSPLQESLGNSPVWKGKRVPNKGVLPGMIKNITQE